MVVSGRQGSPTDATDYFVLKESANFSRIKANDFQAINIKPVRFFFTIKKIIIFFFIIKKSSFSCHILIGYQFVWGYTWNLSCIKHID